MCEDLEVDGVLHLNGISCNVTSPFLNLTSITVNSGSLIFTNSCAINALEINVGSNGTIRGGGKLKF